LIYAARPTASGRQGRAVHILWDGPFLPHRVVQIAKAQLASIEIFHDLHSYLTYPTSPDSIPVVGQAKDGSSA